MGVAEAATRLRELGDPASAEGMRRFGIGGGATIHGVSMPTLRRLGKELGADDALARLLWEENVRELRILATLIAAPENLTEARADAMVASVADWEMCDQLCMNLLERWPAVVEAALRWSRREEEYVKRAGFVCMARLAIARKSAPDDFFHPFLRRVVEQATDPRPMVKKGISWALRQIGKRNAALQRDALALAHILASAPAAPARWVGKEARRDLTSEATMRRLHPPERPGVGGPLRDRDPRAGEEGSPR